MDLPPRPPLRRKKVQAFLSDDDFAVLAEAAQRNKEEPGALASRILAGFVAGTRKPRLTTPGSAGEQTA